MIGRRKPAPFSVADGEKVLAWTPVEGGAAGGTRDALYLSLEAGESRIPWEQVEAADWDSETSVLTVSEVGTWGELRPVHRLTIDDPSRFLQLLRERVSASVVLQRHVAVAGRGQGVRVIARRAPSGDQPIAWVYEFDEGIDPDDPEVRRVAADALAAARRDVGIG